MDLPDRFFMSAVVLMELTASARDDSQRKPTRNCFASLFRQYGQDNSLIVPNENDWLLASRVLYWLTQSRRRSAKGNLKQLPTGTSQRMALNVLIAVSARRWKATVVTENLNDFKAIQRFCNTKIVRASDFFRRD